MPCTDAPDPITPINDALAVFQTFTGEVTFGIAGTGTRDHDFTTMGTVSLLNPNPSLTVIKAYLYWNTIGAKDQDASHVKFNGSDIFGTEIAWCGNTLWAKSLGEDTGPASWAASNIINHVYRYDVTGILAAGNTISIVGNKPDASISTRCGTPQYPGCNGSQGIILFVVYKDPCTDRHIIIWDGAKQLTPSAYIGNVGGSSSYSLAVPAGSYIYNASFFTGVGDAGDGDGTDCTAGLLSWNGNPLGNLEVLPNNLIHALIENNVPALATNTATASTTTDGLCWFLAAYIGGKPCEPPCADAPDPTSPYDQLNFFNVLVGEYDIVGNGVGTRDINTNITPANIPLTVPGKPFEAYLYWNVLGKKDLNASAAIFDGNNIIGDEIGWCGDTCWLAKDDGTHTDGATTEQYIRNKVYKANVTSLVSQGSNTYSVSLPGIDKADCRATLASDQPFYPGCCGSQGIVLIVIYHICEKDCCGLPTGTGGRKKIVIWDGCKLVLPAAAIPLNGGTTSYTIDVDATCAHVEKSKIIAAMGDAQTGYSDSFTWNGSSPFPPNGFGSDINPNKGNLLFYGEASVTAVDVNSAVLDCSSGTECLTWFLFVYVGNQNCCCNGPNPCSPKDELTYWKGFLGDVDFTLGCVGFRDFDTNITPAMISVSVPCPVKAAYLYWNTLGQRDWNPFVAIFNGARVEGCNIGWCGNTCWWACPDGSGNDGYLPCPPQNIINRVYRADVTGLVSGSGTYTLSIPTCHPHPGIAVFGSDTPHYPGCHGGQGAVLLVIYECPERFPQPSCCPPNKRCKCKCKNKERPCKCQTVFKKQKQVLIFDGAVLIIPVPQDDGGTPTYSVPLTTYYNNNIKIATAAGDAQTLYGDDFYWDGVEMPEGAPGSYFNPICGNLMHAKIEYPGGVGECCTPKSHVATVALDEDDIECLCWFLFVYYGDQICLDSSMTIKKV